MTPIVPGLGQEGIQEQSFLSATKRAVLCK